MDIIVDTNIYLAVALDEPEKDRIIAITQDCRAIAPEILPYEIGNALSAMFKRNRLTQDEVLSAFEVTQQIPVELIPVDIEKALNIAMRFNIYAYDAYFIQCAIALNCPILTLDKKMKETAKALNIELLE
ncbi:MAG: type II toxin-antitoxin system VapC family toxin [Proteobacteria bacterium]|nr:type II toxin-antitoxin system VapC family toxin [Pseudomonadota bacterium]